MSFALSRINRKKKGKRKPILRKDDKGVITDRDNIFSVSSHLDFRKLLLSIEVYVIPTLSDDGRRRSAERALPRPSRRSPCMCHSFLLVYKKYQALNERATDSGEFCFIENKKEGKAKVKARSKKRR